MMCASKRVSATILVSLLFVCSTADAQLEPAKRDVTFSVGATAVAIPEGFSFQGQLQDDGTPAEGEYDFIVGLYSVPSGGSALVSTTFSNHLVENGTFDFSLPWGGQYFWQEARFLQLSVRDGASSGSYDVVSPRSFVLGAPFAMSLPNVFSDPSVPFVGVGRSNTVTAAEVFGIESPAVGSADYGGMYINTAGADARPFYGYANDGVVSAYHFFEGLTGKWKLQIGLFNRLTVQSNGNIGVGVDSPEELLHVDGADADILVGNSSDRHVLIEGESSIGSAVRLYNSANTETIRLDAEEVSGQGSTVALYNASGTRTIELDADYGGGTGNPGRVITDELELNGSDVAERFDVTPLAGTAAAEPGMVVSIDPNRPGRLVISAKPYDRAVVGIISGAGDVRPGIYMGQEGTLADGVQPVAVAGRAYALVDAAYGAIAPGDLLTTSATPGYAMLAVDSELARGAVIGKAMTSLKEGTGLVLLFVALQ